MDDFSKLFSGAIMSDKMYGALVLYSSGGFVVSNWEGTVELRYPDGDVIEFFEQALSYPGWKMYCIPPGSFDIEHMGISARLLYDGEKLVVVSGDAKVMDEVVFS